MLFNLRPKQKEKTNNAGFMFRMFASFVDTLLFTILTTPVFEIISRIFGKDLSEEKIQSLMLSAIPKEGLRNSQELVALLSEFFRIMDENGILLTIGIVYTLQIVIFSAVTMAFWSYKSATPGKMLFRMEIVDAKTGEKPTRKQWFLRCFGYFVSLIPLGLGFLWISFDKRHQGWHDKIARTVVVYKRKEKDKIISDVANSNAENK